VKFNFQRATGSQILHDKVREVEIDSPCPFVSHTPGVELIMEAFEGYWRKVLHVKRLVFKSVPEATTRLAMLKQGELDVAYLPDAPLAEEVTRDPTLKVAFSGGIGTFFYPWSAPLEDVRLKKG
jgi:ABC-type transport system substrate-binding protein